ncbi:MAG: phospholipase [Bacteroidota bacterium]
MIKLKRLFYVLLFLPLVALGQNGEFTQLNYTCQDGVERPYIIYTPENLDKNSPKPLLIYLHGAISNPNLKKDPLDYIQKSKLLNLADEGGFYLMFSYGQKGATWFDEVGTNMVLGQIKNAQQQLSIDSNKIFLSGFSDGASGVLYFSMINPMPFAGFISMNGSLKVAQKLGERGVFPANMNQKPMYIINTTKDLLYPIKQIKPVINYLKHYNQNLTFSSPDANHEMSYLEGSEKDNILAFIENNSIQIQKELSWETTSLVNTDFNWIAITKIDTFLTPEHWHVPYQLNVFNDKADFGLKYDYSFQGKGLKVNDFKSEDCTAKKMGVRNGDIIIMMENDTLHSPYSPYYYIATKTAGDSTSLKILRDDNEITVRGKFNEGYYYEIFDRTTKSAKLITIREDEKLMIHTSNITEIKIDFNKLEHKFEEIFINEKLYPLDSDGVQFIQIK